MPYGDTVDVGGPLRVKTYRGLISWLGEEEPYMPDRVLRQFGRAHGVPIDPIIPSGCRRSQSIRGRKGYELKFDLVQRHWHERFDAQYQVDLAAHPPTPPGRPWFITDDYIEWFRQRSHICVLSTSHPAPEP